MTSSASPCAASRPAPGAQRPRYAGAEESKCPATVSALAALGFEPFGTNCTAHAFMGARGCEADMTFVRPGEFDEPLVRTLCTAGAGWPHSCGPGAWSKFWRAHTPVWEPDLSHRTKKLKGKGKAARREADWSRDEVMRLEHATQNLARENLRLKAQLRSREQKSR